MTVARSLLVDWTSRLYRTGKARVSAEVVGILDRLGTSAEFWQSRLKKLFGKPRLVESNFATSRDRLRDVATRRGVPHLDDAVALSG
jgi:hypothetical protein